MHGICLVCVMEKAVIPHDQLDQGRIPIANILWGFINIAREHGDDLGLS